MLVGFNVRKQRSNTRSALYHSATASGARELQPRLSFSRFTMSMCDTEGAPSFSFPPDLREEAGG